MREEGAVCKFMPFCADHWRCSSVFCWLDWRFNNDHGRRHAAVLVFWELLDRSLPVDVVRSHAVISARTRVFGLVGHPVRHSLSPDMYNVLFRRVGIDAIYVGPSDLSITLEDRQLMVRGRGSDDEARTFLHRGIASRQFQRAFVLGDGVEVPAS